VRLAYLAFFAIIAILVIGFAVSSVRGPVPRARVERFARRQRLTINVGNGEQVIRYLATIRRWRAAGLAAGILVSLATPPPGAILHVNFVMLFVGWFVGALVAEVRVAHLAHGPRRAASLQPRRPSSYLPRSAWALVPVTAGLAMAVGLATGIAGALDRAAPDWTAVLWLVVSLALAITVRAIELAVLRRPQPLAEPDVLAADDAIRSRSLHVLAGGGAALILFCVFAQLGAVHPFALYLVDTVEAIRTVGVFAAAVIGWTVATATWPPRPRAIPPPGVTPAGAQ